MSANIRKAAPEDAPAWITLVKAVLGDDHPNKQVYEPAWVTAELASGLPGNETWVADDGGKIQASISVLGAVTANENPVCNLGRNLFHPTSYADGSAYALLQKLTELAILRRQMCVTRVLASDGPQQVLVEKSGFVCVGFQPLKHITKTREEVLFYVKRARSMTTNRLPLSESLPQIGELAAAALQHLGIPGAPAIRDGGTGYPLQTDVVVSAANEEDYKAARETASTQNPPQEISSNFNWGTGFMRVASAVTLRAVLCRREEKVVAGMRYLYDEQDRCVRIMDAFCTDNLSMGAVLQHVAKAHQRGEAAHQRRAARLRPRRLPPRLPQGPRRHRGPRENGEAKPDLQHRARQAHRPRAHHRQRHQALPPRPEHRRRHHQPPARPRPLQRPRRRRATQGRAPLHSKALSTR
jgi:hypothetical protein